MARNTDPKHIPLSDKHDNALGEFEIIARYFAPLANHPGAFNLKDDAAAIAPPKGCDLVVTMDTLVSGIHFLEGDPADLIACKALRVNLSDLAAKGAQPIGYLLSLSLNDDWSEGWLEQFGQGLRRDQTEFEITLLGGDTVRTPGPLTISITALGAVPSGQMVRRDTVAIGDALYVTGTIGDAALGLQLRLNSGATEKWNLSEAHSAALQRRYLKPEPRMKISQILVDCASAAMDVSDGLIGDLAKMLGEQGMTAQITSSNIPLSEMSSVVIANDPEAMPFVLAGGDDYEILAAVSPDNMQRFEQLVQNTGIPIRRIGYVVAGVTGVEVKDQHGRRVNLTHGSYAHF